MIVVFILGFLVPQNLKIPVQDATKNDYNSDSFWYYPWGKSVTHKGVDIFAKKGTPIVASTHGLVLFQGNIRVGGKIVIILGPKWRIHYYAHLDQVHTSIGWVTRGEPIGSVGQSGNAAGKPAHLHYAIRTLLPYPWRIDDSIQGWKKMFYLNPIDYF